MSIFHFFMRWILLGKIVKSPIKNLCVQEARQLREFITPVQHKKEELRQL